VLSGLPLGCTSIIGAITTGVLKVSVTCPAAQPASTSTITISGTENGKTRTGTTELLVVTDMGISLSSSSLTVAPGASVQTTIAVANVATFTAPVALSIAGLPTGVSPTVSAQSLNNTSTTLTLTVAATVPVGTYQFSISGTGGTVTRTAIGTLIVSTTPAPVVSTPAVAPTPAATTVAPTATVVGVNNAELTLTVTPVTNTTAVNGGNVRYTINVTGTALAANGGAVITVSGLPTNVSMSVTPNPTSSTATLSVTSAIPGALGTFPITVIATAGAIARSQVVQLVLS
jgi:hypothetical protein